jgi:uncharacterized protein
VKATKLLREPVHGDIELPLELLRLCDTPEFQRLRSIKMLGTAYFVYPGARHSRFEHSLGTCHLTMKLCHYLEVEPSLAVLAASLLHDITHVPFGHTLEDERRVFERHDAPERFANFLPKGELGKALRSLKIEDQVLEILTKPGAVPWHSEVFAGSVGADLLDYLARDAYYCGLNQNYDARILRAFGLTSGGEVFIDACKGGLIRQDIVSEVIHLLRIRYFLSERVYFHHTKTSSGAMISRAVEDALERGFTLQDLEQLGDETLFYALRTTFSRSPVVQTLISALESHRIFKQAYVLTRQVGESRRRELVDNYHLSADKRRNAERELQKTLRIRDGQLIVYCPAFGMQLKEANVKIKTEESPPRFLSSLQLKEMDILKERHQDLWKLYVFVSPELSSQSQRISDACESYFCEPNHLPALRSGQMYLPFN